MSWYKKKKKKKLMLFKVDFEKAFDTVSWKYLDHMLLSLGFKSKWRRWIQVCLHSARSSVLVNGSPSNEFSIKRGLRQGDLLSPFLFIILMEGLRIAMQNVVCSGLIRGAGVSSQDVKDMASDTCCDPGSIGCTIWMIIRIACSRIIEFMMLGVRPESNWRWNLRKTVFSQFMLPITHNDALNVAVNFPHANVLVKGGYHRKVNVFIWRFILDRLPTRLNLSLRGIEIPSIECPICNSGMESVDHIFFDCEVASNIWRLVDVWTNIDMPSFSSWFDWAPLVFVTIGDLKSDKA
ncbi:RNA-directed DNA polymerase, eukaryota, reverse transcriptase zinc-binding domain protein, partial [Tanacetum coccineum]